MSKFYHVLLVGFYYSLVLHPCSFGGAPFKGANKTIKEFYVLIKKNN